MRQRLRALRDRGATLAALAEATGFSIYTLRLDSESGKRGLVSKLLITA